MTRIIFITIANYQVTVIGALFLIALLISFAGYASANAMVPLKIETKTGPQLFAVEVKDTPETRARGLMHRPSLPLDHGMLFDFQRTEIVHMWMKNTYIPLDMLFIRADGSVAHIVRETVPHSRDIIGSTTPVRYVLEINAGLSDELGIAIGDQIILPEQM